MVDMDYLQASMISPDGKFKRRLLNIILILNYVAILITFLLNFLGLPILKYHYLIHVGLAIIAIFLFDFSQVFPILLTLFFIEGQGRIIWEYASWSRIIFDSIVFISVLKVFISSKKIFDSKKLPAPLIILIVAHFFWYLVEFSNLYSVSYFAFAATSKIYIYPLLLFAAIAQSDLDVQGIKFQRSLKVFILLLSLELALTFYQFNMREQLLLQISPYYFKVMKEGVFTGMLFRPFGTTQLPGAPSVFLFLCVGFLFLRKSTRLFLLLKYFLITASGAAIILCQVRSAFIKFVLIVLLIHLGELIYYRFKLKGLSGLLFISLIIAVSSQYVLNTNLSSEDDGINYARDRISSLSDINKLRSSRLNISDFSSIVIQKLWANPMGLGPGMTGAAGSLSQEGLVGNRFVNPGMTWTSDNLIISLVIDFGVGAIFYILVLFYIPFYFFRFLIIFFQKKIFELYKPLLICFSTIIVILIGNWGAIGITYNPESFAFWLFSALGFSTIAKYKNQDQSIPYTLSS